MKIEILCTGDEILSGKTVNTNYSYMARRLHETGFSVFWGTVVGDDRDGLVQAFQQASERADVVIVNGGLGPTVDDLSQEIAAAAAGVELVLHQEWLGRIAAWYQARGRTMPPNNHKQAMLPEGAEFIDNPVGTACGFALTIHSARFFFTPGVPSELQRMLEEQILPRLQGMRGTRVATRVKRFHTFGIGESRADQLLDGVEELAPGSRVKLGFQSHYPQLEIKLTANAGSETELDRILSPVEEAVRQRLHPFILAENGDTVEGVIIDNLKNREASLSVLEMDTGGAIAGRLIRAADTKARIRQGLIAVDNEEIARILELDPGDGRETDERFAALCARKLRIRSGSTYALAVLMSRPGTGPDHPPCASIYFALSGKSGTFNRKTTLPGTRNWVLRGATEMGMDYLRRHLLGLPTDERNDFEQH